MPVFLRATLPWAVFLGAILFANRGLFPNIRAGFSRWLAVCGVSLVVALVGGCVLVALGVWFHFSIGGTL